MKKIIITLLLSSIFFSSCEESLNIVQDGELNDETLFTNVSNMQQYLNRAYSSVSIQNDIITSSILTDEVALGSAGFPNQTHNFNVFSTNGFASEIWNQHYAGINYMNRVIRGSQNFTPPATDIVAYNNIIAQARALRAFCHLQLLVYFSSDMSNDNALGVMKLDFVPTPQQKIPRSTNGEIFQLIEQDLDFAFNNLSNANNYLLANKNMVNALRARMYLYRKNYVLAEQYADAVLSSGIQLSDSQFSLPTGFPTTSSTFVPTGTGTGSTSFDALPTGTNSVIQTALFNMDRHTASINSPNYRKVWVDGIQGECIFSLVRLNNAANFGSQYNTNQSYISGGPLWDMSRSLYELFTQPLGGGAEDFRRWAFVDRSATIATDPTTATRLSEVIVIDKYPGKSGGHSSNNLKIFRLSEIYFIKAECRIRRDNDRSAAAILIKNLRQARNYISGAVVPTPVYSTNQQAFFDILLERRKELCFEGHRYIDLKRLGSDAGVSNTQRYFKDSENSSATSPSNIAVSDYRFTLPIPQAEINVNPMNQNSGY